MITSAALFLVGMAAPAPPADLQVCLARLPVDPCAESPVQLEAIVSAWGIEGRAALSWSVDGAVRETLTADLVAGQPSRHLVIFEPSASSHHVALAVRLGELSANDELRVGPSSCPSALEVQTVEVVPGRRAVIIVANRGPGASGSWGIRAEVAGAVAYESVVDSLGPGRSYELLLPWDDLVARAGRGRALIPLVVRLKSGPTDLLADQPPYRVLLPRQ